MTFAYFDHVGELHANPVEATAVAQSGNGKVAQTDAVENGGYLQTDANQDIIVNFDTKVILVDNNTVEKGGIPTKLDDLPKGVQNVLAELGF